MNAPDHMTALLGEDPFALAAQIEAAAIEAGTLRAEANHLERVRKVKLSEAAKNIREHAERKMTIPEVEDKARTSDLYREHLTAQRNAEVSASTAEAHYYGLRNRADWLHKAADALRSEAYLTR